MENCIGKNNKLDIKELKLEIDYLKKEVESMRNNTPSKDSLHHLELKITSLDSSLEEMKNNNKENRETIKTLQAQMDIMRETIDKIYAEIEEYIESNTKLLLKTENVKEEIAEVKNIVKALAKDMEERNKKEEMKLKNMIMKQVYRNKITITVFWGIVLISAALLIIYNVDLYIHYMNVSEDAVSGIWDKLIELIEAIRG